jgi:cytidylate kinase
MAGRSVVAIDGPAGSGKSTVARRLAARIGFRYLDSGAMYRALTLAAMRAGVAEDDGDGLRRLLDGIEIVLDGERVRVGGEDVTEEIRSAAVSAAVSRVATIAAVRRGMVEKQRAAYPGEDVVVEGRDIGSVVFPDADLKVFLTASPGERARRRAAESGRPVPTVLAELAERDGRDASREHSPLLQTSDAEPVDTTGLGIEEVVERLAELVRRRLGR